jgi:3-dehydroquinate dehydratase-2
MNILVIHGPSLNLLGRRKPEVYGANTLADINQAVRLHAAGHGADVTLYQSNHEGAIIDTIHELCAPGAADRHDAIIINPGAYSHYSYAIRDAIEAVEVPTIEVHISDISKREEFRRVSVIAPVCIEQIYGLGVRSYLAAIDKLVDRAKG